MSSDVLVRLNEGAAVWNSWRSENPDLSVNLSKADLSGKDLSGTDLRRVDLRGAVLREANLTGSVLASARLTGADFSGAQLDLADLSQADARGSYFLYATARQARLRGTNLNGANLTGLDLHSADLSSAVLLETIFVDCCLSGTDGLDLCDHAGPCIIDYRTYLQSPGLPAVFLRGCGLPDELIESYSRLRRIPLSCFLSYSSQDDAFVRRLYSGLQSRGVRCWFAPEDLPIGVKIRPAIDREIIGRDRFVIVLSANSIDSPWVENEVETAFERAYKQKSPFLIPIRLDDSVMTTQQPWAADLRRNFNIGDFRDWSDSTQFERSLRRLLRDLSAQE
jgi:hypothetical protein